MPDPVGREAELDVVDGFLEDAGPGLSALAIVGEPGIGKTTVWEEAVRRARQRGLTVVAARPAAAEAKLAFSGLTDLLAGVDLDRLALLPVPQRRALDVVLLRAEAGRAPGRRVVGTALLSTLKELAAGGELVIALDDAQWLDSPSSDAIAFALHRLVELPLRVIVAARSQAPRPAVLAVLDHARLDRLDLGPLSVAALQRIVADRLGVSFSRPTLVRLAAASKGNAFYALEIARLLDDRGPGARSSDPLPVPDDLRALVRARIERLPRATFSELLRAAAAVRPTAEVVDISALVPAEEAGLISLGRDGSVQFTHPLFASAVYGSAGERDRSLAHEALAAASRDPGERARHLALAARGPDAETARALTEAALSARARGAPAAAAELMQLAIELTPEGGEVGDERRLVLAEHLLLAGDFQRAGEVLEALVASVPPGDLTARALLALAEIEYWREGESSAVAADAAALEAAADPMLRARCLAAIAMHAGTSDLPRAAAAARESLTVLAGREDTEPELVSVALSARVRADLFLGLGLDREAADRALRLERSSGAPPVAVDTRISFKLGQWLRYIDDFDGARDHLVAVERAALEEGDESSLANIVLNRTLLECWSGNWAVASELAERTKELFALTGVPVESSGIWVAYVAAHQGRIDEVRSAADRVSAVAEPVVRMLWGRTLGLAELAAGETAGAATHLADALAALGEMGFREPAVWRVEGDAIEAAVASGELDRAEAVLATFEQAAARSRIPWSLAVSARSRGLVLAARGDVEQARDALEQALTHHARSPVPFELGRTLLVHGRTLRRLKQKRAARDSLEQAAAIFASLGATAWAERAADELGRTAARQAPDGLSATEYSIARLAAAGLTNDAIAAEVMLTRKTVEANLSRAYRKLDIRSRAQLARALDARDRDPIP
ncbi:MAG TPA: AAA family ATPase [Gaiellaceae bacterium]|nr:AAA family ATPase [Gaiellaceae bacterium]